MRVALDAMGGDVAPGPIVAGAVQAVAADPSLTIVLVGDKPRIEVELASLEAPGPRLEILHTAHTVGMHESPVEGLRKKPDNSISRCWQLMATKQVDAVVSAGNTGAVVAGGLMTRKFLRHVRRPGIAAVMPTAKGPCVVLDVGANISPKPLHLLQYGVMGEVFAKHILGRERPTIGLMNVGEEDSKGHDLVKETHDLFRNGPLKDQFKGNVEGRDIHRGAVDVVVTDGFTGNVILKLSEGVLEFVVKLVASEVIGTLTVEREKAGAALKGLMAKYHYSNFGGAPLLGVDGICIICHGSSGDRAIRNALGVAVRSVTEQLNEKIVAELETIPATKDE
jgi:glycerol-3-phosphate acyltransferase PlsX